MTSACHKGCGSGPVRAWRAVGREWRKAKGPGRDGLGLPLLGLPPCWGGRWSHWGDWAKWTQHHCAALLTAAQSPAPGKKVAAGEVSATTGGGGEPGKGRGPWGLATEGPKGLQERMERLPHTLFDPAAFCLSAVPGPFDFCAMKFPRSNHSSEMWPQAFPCPETTGSAECNALPVCLNPGSLSLLGAQHTPVPCPPTKQPWTWGMAGQGTAKFRATGVMGHYQSARQLCWSGLGAQQGW